MPPLPTYPELHPLHPRNCIRPYHGTGLFITATGTDVGKTTATAALAAALHRLHSRVGICKPVASGCPKFSTRGNDPNTPLTDDDYRSPDAELSATAAGLDPADLSLLPYLSPVRFAAPVSPRIAAEIEQRPTSWKRVCAALDWWQENADVLLVEGAGGWFVPLDQHDFMIADLASALRLPVLVVTDANLGALNKSLLTIQAIRQRSLAVAGLILNRIPPPEKRDLALLTNLAELPRLCGVPVRAILPDVGPITTTVPEPLISAMLPFAQEWLAMTSPNR